MRTEGLNKSTPKWLKVKRMSLADDGAHVHKEHAAQAQRRATGNPLRFGKKDKSGADVTALPVDIGGPEGEEAYVVGEAMPVGTADSTADGFALPGASVGGARDETVFVNSGAPPQFETSRSVSQQFEMDDAVSKSWDKVFSTTNQAFYWRHKTSQETSWTKPDGWEEAPLPAGWAGTKDKASGHTFYVNALTGEQTWQRPEPDDTSGYV